MGETVVKSLKVSFNQSLPMGTRATFTHDKQTWIAYPASKNQAIFALVDRLIGLHNRIAKDMVGWINERPQDADLVTRVLDVTGAARELSKELVIDKARTFTQ